MTTPMPVDMMAHRGDDMGRRRSQKTGTLVLKSGSWMLRWREDAKDVAGRPFRTMRSMVIAKAAGPEKIGKREAQRLAWETVLSKLDAVSLTPSAMITFSEFVKSRFEPDHMAALKPSGRTHYEYMLSTHILPKLGHVKLRDFTTAVLYDFFREKQEKGYLKTGTRTPYSTQTIGHMKNAISAVLRHASNCDMFVGRIPTSKLKLPRIENRERGALTTDQATRIIAALPGQYSTLAALLLTTGLRIGEAAGLRWKRVDFETASMEIRENYVSGNWNSPKTLKSIRRVVIPAAVLQGIAALRHRESHTGPDDPVFLTTFGNPIDARTTASRILKPVASRLGMSWVSWHSFRHSNATFADQAGMTVAERRKSLGHGSDSMAMRYSHTDMEIMRAKVELIASAVLPSGNGEIQ